MLRVFLTGATGYIGSAVLDALVRRGHEVTAMVREPERLARESVESVKPAVGSLREPKGWAGKLSNQDVFIHTAFDSSVHGPAADLAAIETILAEARRAAAKGRAVTIVYTSGVWVLGHTAEPAGRTRRSSRPAWFRFGRPTSRRSYRRGRMASDRLWSDPASCSAGRGASSANCSRARRMASFA